MTSCYAYDWNEMHYTHIIHKTTAFDPFLAQFFLNIGVMHHVEFMMANFFLLVVGFHLVWVPAQLQNLVFCLFHILHLLLV